MIDTKIKTFTNLKELGDFLKENRELQNIKIEDASKLLLIKKDIQLLSLRLRIINIFDISMI